MKDENYEGIFLMRLFLLMLLAVLLLCSACGSTQKNAGQVVAVSSSDEEEIDLDKIVGKDEGEESGDEIDKIMDRVSKRRSVANLPTTIESEHVVQRDHVAWSTVFIEPFWFSNQGIIPPFLDKRGDVTAHPFFDASPVMDFQERSINFVPLTFQESNVIWDFDLPSGRPFLRHRMCTMRDIWERYEGKIKNQEYVTGLIPRVLSSSGRPQKILVFGRGDFFERVRKESKASDEDSDSDEDGIRAEDERGAYASHRVRIVGGVIREYCPNIPCKLSSDWKSELLVLAVDPGDDRYQDVREIADLEQRVDFPQFLAYLQNEDGGLLLGKVFYPYYRLINRPLGSEKIANKILKELLIFSKKDLLDIQRSCLNLYRYMWSNLGQLKKREMMILEMDMLSFMKSKRTERSIASFSDIKISTDADADADAKKAAIPVAVKEAEEDKVFTKSTFGFDEGKVTLQVAAQATATATVAATTLTKTQVEQLVKQGAEADKVAWKSDQEINEVAKKFYDRFNQFHEKFSTQFFTCSKYVKASDPRLNYNHHWFFTYIEAFYLLRSLGYVYNCNSKQWDVATSKSDLSSLVAGGRSGGCSALAFELAFEGSIVTLEQLLRERKRSYRYIEYDVTPMGSHEKLYSWVGEEGLTLNCVDEQERGKTSFWDGEQKSLQAIFPPDVTWPSFLRSMKKWGRADLIR
ncbi:MAG: hypothetical protein HQK50_13910 [Oligoflexia bacterium]|nr:hypothetical protein [Oligoflexia bacterium]